MSMTENHPRDNNIMTRNHGTVINNNNNSSSGRGLHSVETQAAGETTGGTSSVKLNVQSSPEANINVSTAAACSDIV